MTNFGLSHYSIRSARFSKGFRAETVSAPFHPQRHAGTVPFKSRRPDTRGRSHPAGSHGAGTRANVISFPLPSGSLPGAPSPSLESLNLSDTMRNVIVALFGFLFLLSVALAFVGSVFLCLFCHF